MNPIASCTALLRKGCISRSIGSRMTEIAPVSNHKSHCSGSASGASAGARPAAMPSRGLGRTARMTNAMEAMH
eukprot:5537358-Prymnesium_polylepis.1